MVFGLIIRGGLLAGAVYSTSKVGVWGSTVETEQLYNNIKAKITPYAVQVKQQLPFAVPELPRTGEMRFLAKHYYNEGVKNTFRFVHMLPCYAGRGLKKVKDTFNEFAKSPSTAESAANKQ